MQVVRGDQNGYPVLGGIAGTPYPRGYTYGGFALQVGIWVTGRQPLPVERLLGGVHCGLGRGRVDST
jgi:hypothetical protein